MNGIIIKIESNFISVQTIDKKIYTCIAKGIFRYENLKPIVGDNVNIEKNDSNNNIWIITKIYQRKNFLKRPVIANIDQVIIITSCKLPNFNSFILNKYLFIIEYLNIYPILIFTKKDLLDLKKDINVLKQITWYKKMCYSFFIIDNVHISKKNISCIRKQLENKISVFAGQTGAGKSTTINNLIGLNKQKTAPISKSLGRGKHTTRVTEFLFFKNAKIIDTPGFSAFDMDDINLSLLSQKILPFKKYWNKCKFNNCLHINEPECEIIKLVKNKIIPDFFYEDYKKIILRYNKNMKGSN